jgi:hypothetical protein
MNPSGMRMMNGWGGEGLVGQQELEGEGRAGTKAQGKKGQE